MRFPNSLFQLLGAGKKGVKLEPGDGVLQLPAILSAVAELPAPVTAFGQVESGVIEKSHADQLVVLQIGAVAGSVSSAAGQLAAGVWRIRAHFYFTFRGTANQASILEFGIGNAATGSLRLTSFPLDVQAGQIFLQSFFAEWVFHFLREQTLLVNVPATIVGDALQSRMTYVANRLL